MTAGPPDLRSAAERLCAQCGLCCNGVLFATVQLQPADSAKDLAALGLKLKHKHRGNFILQPCPALQNLQCSIYKDRPQRCRLFECLQLKRLAAAEITEALALKTIHEARHRVDHMNELLLRAGKTNLKRPLSKRCEKAMAEPLTPSSDQSLVTLRSQLTQAMQELETLLDGDFRTGPKILTNAAEADPVANR